MKKRKKIKFYSSNISELFRITEDILDHTPEYFPDFFFPVLESAHYQKIYLKLTEPVKYYDRIIIGEKPYHFTIYKSGTSIFLEFEETDEAVKEITNSLKFFNMAKENDDSLEIWEELTKLLRATIDYDRVMIYQFLEDGIGNVIAESKHPEMESYLHLYYPESDIPKQARALYLQNTRRIFSNIYEPEIPIFSTDSNPVDLTDSELRSMSPVHAEYLKNSGVSSSFSISIIVDNKLWGLVTCHSARPKHIELQDRIFAEILTSIAVSQFTKTLSRAEFRSLQDVENQFTNIRRKLAKETDIFKAISSSAEQMLKLIGSNGFAVFEGDRNAAFGDIPARENWQYEIIQVFEDEERTHSSRDFFYDEEAGDQNKAAGFLAVKFNDLFLVWFRNEFREHINWAGNPAKEFRLEKKNGEEQMVVSPRTSFQVFSEQTKGKSRAWSTADQQKAEQVQELLSELTANYYQKIFSLNEDLTRLNNELHSFSYTVAHDLTNPLTSLKLNAQMLERKKDIDAGTKEVLGKIVEQADHMDALISKILDISKLQSASVNMDEVSVSAAVMRIRDELKAQHEDVDVILKVDDLPAVYGDEIPVYQVFANVISNALKYSAKEQNPIVKINGENTGTETVYTVEDNGIGIPEDEIGKIFNLFGRMQNAADYEGNGVGLAIAKNLMTKMGGAIDVESKEGEYTRVTLTFKTIN